jgi:hypothetical protein
MRSGMALGGKRGCEDVGVRFKRVGEGSKPLSGDQDSPEISHVVVLWSEFLATDSEVPGSIPGPTRFSEKYGVWNGVHSAS